MYEGEYHNIRHRMMSNERPGPEGSSNLKQGALLVTGTFMCVTRYQLPVVQLQWMFFLFLTLLREFGPSILRNSPCTCNDIISSTLALLGVHVSLYS